MDYEALSKEISYALRHAPWEYELELDEAGFVPVEQLLVALNESVDRVRAVILEDLREVIRTSSKQRHEIVGDKIRALYGHSTPQKVAKEPAQPPQILYHGTPRRLVDTILDAGLEPMSRQYVHLSVDVETARLVGARRDAHPAVLEVAAAEAFRAGVAFYPGNDKVWLADSVPARFIARIED